MSVISIDFFSVFELLCDGFFRILLAILLPIK